MSVSEDSLTAKSILMKVLVEQEQSLEWAKSDLTWTERALSDAQLRVKEQEKKVSVIRQLVNAS